jgi:hypothetical protein
MEIPMRIALPTRRPTETFKFRFQAQRAAYHLSMGYYPDGKLGEVFLSTNQTGSQSEAIAHDFATLISLLLQHGCDLETIRNALTHDRDGNVTTIAGTVVDLLIEKGEGL